MIASNSDRAAAVPTSQLLHAEVPGLAVRDGMDRLSAGPVYPLAYSLSSEEVDRGWKNSSIQLADNSSPYPEATNLSL